MHFVSDSPRITVVILSFNGMEHLPELFQSLSRQSADDFEVVVVDNNSEDGSPEWVSKNYPHVHLIRSGKNLGFCAGMNLGISTGRGEYVFLLNQDTVLDPNCIKILGETLESKSETWIGAFPMVRFYHAPMFINAFGADWYADCQWRDTRVGLPDLGQFTEPEQVFGSIFPAVMFRRDKILEIGAFDAMFWSYNEDFDVCYRTAVFGYKFIAVPSAILFHKYRASSRDTSDPLWSRYWFVRNYFLVFLKNYERKSLIRYWRILFLRYMGFSFKAALNSRNYKEMRLYLRILAWLVFRSPWIFKRRFFIQLHRKIPDNKIWKYGKIEQYNLYHYDGAIVLSLRSLRAANENEDYEYRIGDQIYRSI